MSTGRIALPIAEPQRSRLMEVRRGELALTTVLERLHQASTELERGILAAQLPQERDRDRVDRSLVAATGGPGQPHREPDVTQR